MENETVFRLTFQRTTTQSIDFEILATSKEEATKKAQASMLRVTGWKDHTTGPVELVAIDEGMHHG